MPGLVRVALVVVGILAVVVGVIYLVEPIHSLPSFFPGHASGGQGHHHIRGYIAIAVGAGWCSLPPLPGALAAAGTDTAGRIVAH